MNDVADTLHSVLVAQAGAGAPLELLGSRIYRDANDFMASVHRTRLTFPLLLMHVGPAQPLDALRGSAWQAYEGEVVLEFAAAPPPSASDVGWETAREACETLGGNLEKVLQVNRWKASASNPLGCWYDLQFSGAEDVGGRGKVDAFECWSKRLPCRLRFSRRRA